MIFIAEIGLNNNGHLNLAYEMIRQAKLTLSLCLTSVLLLSVNNLFAQDTKREFAPKKVETSESQPTKRKVDLGPASPRINSTDMVRRAKESNLKKLIYYDIVRVGAVLD